MFEIEDKDEHYLIYSALSEQEGTLKNKLLEYENKSNDVTYSENDIKMMDEISKTLNYINAVKKIQTRSAETSILETENMFLKAELELLK